MPASVKASIFTTGAAAAQHVAAQAWDQGLHAVVNNSGIIMQGGPLELAPKRRYTAGTGVRAASALALLPTGTRERLITSCLGLCKLTATTSGLR